MQKATFGAGCFWQVEAAFKKLKGVVSTSVGYTGGKVENPSYRNVCSGNTGHLEAVEVTYDPLIISYKELLKVFWKVHDPTSLNRQGPDIGTQYRSAIFFHNKKQQSEALESKKQIQKKYNEKVVTEIMPISKYYKAEEYHQNYLEKQGLSKVKGFIKSFF